LSFPIIERLSGVINGYNVVFETSRPYVPGSLKVFHNGLLGLEELVDGWVELGNGRIRLKEIPREGDILQAYYLPR
jgi:hypothetical protein